jgi:hypothetical protein
VRRTWIALAVVAATLFVGGAGCGHRHDGRWYVTHSGYYAPFAVTFVNATNGTLLPGPIRAEPYEPYIPTVAIPPGGRATYSIGFLPSRITVSAIGIGPFGDFTYPTRTLYLGIDYFSDASEVTFVYH